METATPSVKKKWPRRKIILAVAAGLLLVIAIAAFFVYRNFNRLLSDALVKSFNANLLSDVYELKFEGLSVNFLAGNIEVHNVLMQPREKPLHPYPYINSSFVLKTEKMRLQRVEFRTLLQTQRLKLARIEIIKPDVSLVLDGSNYILFPLSDTTQAVQRSEKKNPIQSFFLEEFAMVDANFHVTNRAKLREFTISQLNISLKQLTIDQHNNRTTISNKQFVLAIGGFTGKLQQTGLRHVAFNNFALTIDSLRLQQSVDTSIYQFNDFSTRLSKLNIETADSLFHLAADSFGLSYKQQAITLKQLVFKPNMSEAAMQKRFKYQTSQFSGSVGSLQLRGVNFDSLLHGGKVFVDQLTLDKLSASIFKDQRKPFDRSRFPGYPGQQVQAMGIPMRIKQVKVTNASLLNRELKPDGHYAQANIKNATITATNFTTLPSTQLLLVHADAYIEGKAHARITLGFDYNHPHFSINGRIARFNLPDLNPLLQSYTPARVEQGIVDEITFSGNAYRTNASGSFTFLYHDLKVDLAMEDKAKWMSSVLAFAANTYLHEANPASANVPPRVVHYEVERDMNKGFVNILIKSVLSGLKETMIMSKENKKAYKEAKKEMKKEQKAAKKKARKEAKK